MAGASGILFANCVFVSPTMFSLLYTAQVIVWVIIGGLGTLLGPVFACFLLQMITAELGRLNWLNPNFVLGVILIGFVLLMPSGIQPTLRRLYERSLGPSDCEPKDVHLRDECQTNYSDAGISKALRRR